jgi:hypothetical protein
MPPVTDAEGTSAQLILNPAAGSVAGFRGRLTRTARERGIRVRVLEPGEDATLAALEAPLRFSVDPGALRVPEGAPSSRQVPPLEAGWHAAQTLRRWLRPSPGS